MKCRHVIDGFVEFPLRIDFIVTEKSLVREDNEIDTALQSHLSQLV